MKRETGYYWVRFKNETKFIIGYYNESRQAWYLCSNNEFIFEASDEFFDSEFEQIDEKRIER